MNKKLLREIYDADHISISGKKPKKKSSITPKVSAEFIAPIKFNSRGPSKLTIK